MFKRFKVIFFSLLMVIANEGVGQASNNDVRRSLEGSWLLLEQHSDSLFLKRNLIGNFNQGHRFELN